MRSPYTGTDSARYHEAIMRRSARLGVCLAASVVALSLGLTASPHSRQTPTPTPTPTATGTVKPDVIWIATDDPVVTAMLKLAHVTKTDVVYDLGCGDGKIVIAAARQFGARGVGIEIDPERVKAANAAVKAAGVGDRVKIIEGNIFDPAIPIRDATVVTLFLLESLNEKLRPRLQSELRPGTRVVSNAFHMGNSWPADRTEDVGSSTIYLWTIKPAAPLLQLRH
jgi:SAM-dependent methyltransferase